MEQIEEFIHRCVDRAGGVVEAAAPGLLNALLPPPLDQAAHGRSLAHLALEPERLDQAPQAELATIGSPFMDALISYAAGLGLAATGHINLPHVRKRGIRDEVEKAITISNGRVRFPDRAPDMQYSWYAQFNFRVEFLSDERRERLYILPVDLWSGQPNLSLVQRLSSLCIESERPTLYSNARQKDLGQAYQTSLRTLAGLVEQESAHHLNRVRKRFGVEFSRIHGYYQQVGEELERRLEREADDKRRADLQQKMHAAANERERKLRDLADKYRLRRRARLTSARLLSQLKSFYTFHVDRGQITRSLTVAYDPLLEKVDLPSCESCGREMSRILITSAGQLWCQECSTKQQSD